MDFEKVKNVVIYKDKNENFRKSKVCDKIVKNYFMREVKKMTSDKKI